MPLWLTDPNGNTKADSIPPTAPDAGSASWAAFGDSKPVCYRHEYSKRYRNCHAFSYSDCDSFSYSDCYSQCNCFNYGYSDRACSSAPISPTIQSLHGTQGVSRGFRT